jgi:hypothetical protein
VFHVRRSPAQEVGRRGPASTLGQHRVLGDRPHALTAERRRLQVLEEPGARVQGHQGGFSEELLTAWRHRWPRLMVRLHHNCIIQVLFVLAQVTGVAACWEATQKAAKRVA